MGFRFGHMEDNMESSFLKDLDERFVDNSGRKNRFSKFSLNNPTPDYKNVFSIKNETNPTPKPTSFSSTNSANSYQKSQNLVKPSQMNSLGKHTYNNSNLQKGQSVRHEKFGEGMILDFQNDKVIINFNGDVKTLLLKFAKLEVVE